MSGPKNGGGYTVNQVIVKFSTNVRKVGKIYHLIILLHYVNC